MKALFWTNALLRADGEFLTGFLAYRIFDTVRCFTNVELIRQTINCIEVAEKVATMVIWSTLVLSGSAKLV